jgi:hypothetical protein
MVSSSLFSSCKSDSDRSDYWFLLPFLVLDMALTDLPSLEDSSTLAITLVLLPFDFEMQSLSLSDFSGDGTLVISWDRLFLLPLKVAAFPGLGVPLGSIL